MAEQVLKEYDVTLDPRKRFTLRGKTSFDRYHVRLFADGSFVAEPRVLVSPKDLSKNAQKMVYLSIKNLKKGKAGSSVDFTGYTKYLED
jgi:hypothetical protein